MRFFFYLFLGILTFLINCSNAKEKGIKKNLHSSSLESSEIQRKKYNVLLITLDTLRQDRISIYTDQHVHTPNLDALAKKSFIFTRAFSHNPVTLPAHTNILTGTTPQYHGISDNMGFRLEDHFLTLAEYLKGSGYSTGAFIGSFPLDSRFGLNQGFDVYDDNYGTHSQMEIFFVERRAEKVIRPAINWLSQQIKNTNNKWFSWIHLFDAHQPYLPPAPFDQKYSHDLYSGEVAYIDACLKKLFDYLQDNQLMDNTIIVIVGDHGEALGEKGEETHSYFAYNNTILIPLIIYLPGIHAAGTSETEGIFVDDNVCHSDIFPTICDALDVKIPKHIQGISLIPLLSRKISNPKSNQEKIHKKSRDIYFESLTPYLNRGWAPLWGFIREDTKFIHQPIVEVYNIKIDHQEKNNIAEQSNITQLKRDLIKLKRDLTGKNKMERSKQIDTDSQQKLKSLGYISGKSQSPPSRKFTKADDLKTMLPIHNRMLTAQAEYQKGNYQKAISELLTVIEESPSFILLYRQAASIFKELGQLDKAIGILEKGLKKNPGNGNLISKLGIMLAEANNPEKAIKLLELCIKKDLSDPENFNYLGVAYFKKRDFKKALYYYKKALQLDNNYASVFNNIGSLYLAQFLKSKKTDNQAYQLAMDNFNRALKIDPRLFAAYNGRGAAYRFKNYLEKAIIDWQKTIEINPNYLDSYFNIGITYLQMNRKSEALEILLRCRNRFKNKLSNKDQQQLERLILQSKG